MTTSHHDQNKTNDSNAAIQTEAHPAPSQDQPSIPSLTTASEIIPENASPQTQHVAANNAKKTKLKILLLILLILVLGFIGYGLWKSYQPKMIEIQGRVEAETIQISTKVPSRIEEIYVHEGQVVKKGQALVRLHSAEVDAKKQQALGLLQSALALQATTDRGAQQENKETFYANWQSLKAQAQLAATTYQRGTQLYKEGVISRQRRDEMQAAAISSQQFAEAAYQQYARLQRGSTPEQKSTADAQVEIAQAAVNEANALEAETQLVAPLDGTIAKIFGNVSELVVTAVPVVSLIDTHNIWVNLNVREDQYAHVYKAKTLEGYIPALQQSMTFQLTSINPEGNFATIKNTRQTGGYDIHSFKVHLKPINASSELKIGMSVLFKVQESK